MRRARLAALLAALLALLACDDDDAVRPLLNRCQQQFECLEGSLCDMDLGICVQPRTGGLPYQVALQVVPEPSGDGGVLAARSLPPQSSLSFGDIPVPSTVLAVGSVTCGEAAIQAEVAFTPTINTLLGRAVDVFTQPSTGGEPFYLARLEPNLAYRARVYPLGRFAADIPPFDVADEVMSGTDFDPGLKCPDDLVTIQRQLLDENGDPPPAGLQVKLRRRDNQEVVSSLGTLDRMGRFTVRAAQEVIDDAAEHELLLNLSPRGTPQNLTIAFDFDGQVASDAGAPAVITMPVVPRPTQYIGSVEIADLELSPTSRTIDAEVTFVSSFPIPSEPGQVANRDWCQLRTPGMPSNFRCNARVTAAVSPQFGVTADLYPGDYQVFITPAGNATDQQRVATTNLRESVSTQVDGVQQGRALQVNRATLFDGNVTSPTGRAMPGVTVTANALGALDSLPLVARYNRTAQQISAGDGSFKLAVDIGIYDLIAAPPEGSGFAWVLSYNRRIDGTTGPVTLRGPCTNAITRCLPIEPQLPVLGRGRVLDPAGRPVPNARVDAFAIVPGLGDDAPERAIRVARTSTGELGTFTLQLPPRIGDRQPEVDAGVSQALTDAGS